MSWNAVSTELQGQGFSVLTPPSLLHGVAGDKALVYVDAFIPDVGETVFQILGGSLGANTAPTETAAWKTIPSWAVVGE